MHALIDEINKHLSETKQRFDELEHAMTALADLVGQLVERRIAEDGGKHPHKVQLTITNEKT